MKQSIYTIRNQAPSPAAFGRLRVETVEISNYLRIIIPAAFGRLRVETPNVRQCRFWPTPAAFGRLRVETIGR